MQKVTQTRLKTKQQKLTLVRHAAFGWYGLSRICSTHILCAHLESSRVVYSNQVWGPPMLSNKMPLDSFHHGPFMHTKVCKGTCWGVFFKDYLGPSNLLTCLEEHVIQKNYHSCFWAAILKGLQKIWTFKAKILTSKDESGPRKVLSLFLKNYGLSQKIVNPLKPPFCKNWIQITSTPSIACEPKCSDRGSLMMIHGRVVPKLGVLPDPCLPVRKKDHSDDRFCWWVLSCGAATCGRGEEPISRWTGLPSYHLGADLISPPHWGKADIDEFLIVVPQALLG